MAEGRPFKALNGGNAVINTYTQDTVLTVPETGDDDRALRRRAGQHVGRLVIDTGELPFAERMPRFLAELPDAVTKFNE